MIDTTGNNGGVLTPTITWNNDHFIYDGTGNHASYTRSGCLLTANDINLFGIKTIRFHVLSSTVTNPTGNHTNLFIGVFDRNAVSINAGKIAVVQLATESQEMWYDIDVSSVDVAYAVGIAASSQTKNPIEIKIDKILYYLDEVVE